ncbi:MAG TPA: ROK family protein [Gaiellaceae bacterium]|nr:ROK family protein [Gaiellaceae bacterium]
MQPHRVIGVDVGGTKTLFAVVTPEGTIEARLERHTVVSSQEALLAELDDGVEELRSAHPETTALGFGIPSRVDQRTGRAVASVNIPLTDVDFRDRMRERHGLPVAIDNDGNAAAIAEWMTGAARGASNVVMLTLGTGVGGGLILGGQPYRGATGSGAELGHIVIEFDGPLCGCGGRGHLEAVASGKAAGQVAQKLYGPEAKGQDLVRRAESGEDDAVRAMAAIGQRLGAAIATFVNIFEPEIVVIGGGFGAASELMLGPAREVLGRDGLAPGRDALRIVEAQLGSDAGVIGAGMIAFEALESES